MSDIFKKSWIPDKRIKISLAWPYLLALLVFVSVRIAIGNEVLVEKYYSTGLYPAIANLFSALSNLVPFSLWDSFWMISIITVLIGLVLSILKRIKFSRYLLRVTQFLALFYSLFYLSWGFNYFRPEIATRLKWESTTLNEQDFRLVLDSLIVKTNRSYLKISESENQVSKW